MEGRRNGQKPGALRKHLIALAALLICSPVFADEDRKVAVETVAEGLNHPWSLVFLPNGDMLVSERAGRIRVISEGKLVAQAVTGTPDVYALGEGGMLGLALHPDFAQNHWLYYAYSHGSDDNNSLRLARARYRDGALSEHQLLFEASPSAGNTNHFGGRILFDHQGFLYLTLGERGQPRQAQEEGNPLGSTIRLTAEGEIPADNPFVGRDGADEVFAYGSRNPQGMALHPQTGEIWQHEHGPRGGDEINLLEKGANYGWPEVTYGRNHDGSEISDRTQAPDIRQPLHYWDPSIAPSGMAFYQGDQWPEWQGDLFVGALAGRKLVRLRFRGKNLLEEEAFLTDLGERIRSVVSGPDGALWVLTDSADGKVLKLTAD